MKFALTGASGYVAPKHMKAIKDVGGDLVAALDPHDSVGVIDSYFPNCSFFTETERFDRFLEKLHNKGEPVDYLSICSPNYLHDAHCRLGLRVGADVICEKPLVLKPRNIDQLKELESRYEKNIHVVLQLRHHPEVLRLKETIDRNTLHKVEIDYVTPRGKWYDYSWKSNVEKSGGLATNIGIHLFDMLIWLFGKVKDFSVTINEQRRCGGYLSLESANVWWFLSINESDLKDDIRRSIIIDEERIKLDNGFTDLHTEVYRNILCEEGYGVEDAKPSIDLVYKLRSKQ